ncbi:hypothetical protein BDZ97DRAFT_2072384 [Flammula alnicola]|nr:hypothetical protein BDZ97DRAFT_2072384 [Flammula alnicola]
MAALLDHPHTCPPSNLTMPSVPSLFHHDEDFINKSLLDSLDAQADAEPLESDIHQQYPSNDSPDDNDSPNTRYSISHRHHLTSQDSSADSSAHPTYHNLHAQDSIFTMHQGLYSSANQHIHTDYNSEYHPQQQQQPTKSVLTSAPSYRDSAPAGFYPNQDVFPSQMTSPVPVHMQPYDNRAAYDYATQSQQQQSVNGVHKSSYLIDPYGSSKPSSQQQQQQTVVPDPVWATRSRRRHFGWRRIQQPRYAPGMTNSVSIGMANGPSNSTTVNGEEISTIFVVGFPEDMQEREFQNMFTFSPGFEAATLKIPNKEYTAYNGLIPPNPGMVNPSAALQQQQQAQQQQQQRNYAAAANDPYNLVTVNQGGVVVDAGRDGGMASWPAAPPGASEDLAAHYGMGMPGPLGALNPMNPLNPLSSLNSLSGGPSASSQQAQQNNPNLPPRKQIIGFAKFRSREEALVARDVLQGRRVDIEKGAVLKAEMAKKNLHTKRGVGPVAGVGGGGGMGAVGLQTQQSQQQGQQQQQQQHLNGAMDAPDASGMAGLARIGLGWRESSLGGLQQQPSSSQGQSASSQAAPQTSQSQAQVQDASSTLNGLANGTATQTKDGTPSAADDERKRIESTGPLGYDGVSLYSGRDARVVGLVREVHASGRRMMTARGRGSGGEGRGMRWRGRG